MAGGDDGFIRANPETPYPDRYLANLLNIELELWERTIRKCVSVGKIIRMEDGVLYVASWKDYKLAPRTKRWLMSEAPADSQNTPPSPFLESNEEDKHSHLNEYRNPPLVPGNDCRVPGKKEEAIDKALEEMRREQAKLDAELEAKRGKP